MSRLMIRRAMVTFVAAVVLITSGSVWAAAQVTETKPAETEEAKANICAGKILVVDAKTSTITIRHKKENKTFAVAPECKFTGYEKKDVTLADLKAGDRARVTFAQDGDKLVARQIAYAEPNKNKQKSKKEE